MGLPVTELLVGHLGRLPVEVALGIVQRVALLLQHAHDAGVVHGALSPQAIWLSARGEVWLEWHPQRSPVHRSLPPEMRQGEEPRIASDVYALAAVAYELLTGLSISRAWAKAPLVHLQDVASVKHFNPVVPSTADTIITLALARHPADRPSRIDSIAGACEPAPYWEQTLAAMIADPFFSPALRDLPVTCERAAFAAPAPAPSLPPPAPLQRPSPPRLVAAPVAAANDDDEDDDRPSSTRLIKIMIATVIAAAASLALCLGASRFNADAGGRAALVSRPLVNAPKVVAAAVAPVPAPEPVVEGAKVQKPAAKVKADRHPAKRHGSKTKRKSR